MPHQLQLSIWLEHVLEWRVSDERTFIDPSMSKIFLIMSDYLRPLH